MTADRPLQSSSQSTDRPAERRDSSGDPAVTRRIIAAPSDPSVEIVVHEVGKGPPIVYLHGLLGLNEHWLPTAKALAPRAHSIMLETPLLSLRGDRCTVQAVANLLADVVEQVIDQPAIVVGSSFGGHVALRLVIDRPKLAAGVVLVGASGLYEVAYEDEIDSGARMKDVEIRPSREWMTRKINELFHDTSRVPEGVIDRVWNEMNNRRAARALIKLSRSSRKDRVAGELEKVTVPALVLWGRQDVVTPPRVARDFEAKLPDARIHWLDDCGHAPMIEKPDEFTAAIAAFLDSVESRKPGAVGSRQEVA